MTAQYQLIQNKIREEVERRVGREVPDLWHDWAGIGDLEWSDEDQVYVVYGNTSDCELDEDVMVTFDEICAELEIDVIC